MKSARIILIIALVVAILPFIGIPASWYRPGIFIGGMVIVLLSMRSVSITFPEIRQPRLFDVKKETHKNADHE